MSEILRLEAKAGSRFNQVLAEGAVVAYPTDTVYGLGCDAANPDALQRLDLLKGRPARKPYSILYSDVSRLLADFPHLNDYQVRLVRRLLPGKVTLVLPVASASSIPANVVADGRVGVRVVDYPALQTLLAQYSRPVVTTSANPADAVPARNVAEILNYFGAQISLILDGGDAGCSLPSTVLRLETDGYEILRAGAVSEMEITHKLMEL